jgi:hypothetical protein
VVTPSQCGALFDALMDLDAVDDIAPLSRALEVH